MLQSAIGSRSSFNVNPPKGNQGLTLTVYDQANAVVTGIAYSPKGDSYNVEFIGTNKECQDYINELRENEYSFNLVVNRVVQGSIVLDALSKGCGLDQGFTLGSLWYKVVQA